MTIVPILAMASGIFPCDVSQNQNDNAFVQIQEDTSNLSVRDVIQTLLDSKCPTQEKVTKWTCKFIVSGDPTTKACHVESTAGYFFVARDLLGNTNIVYTRLD